MSKILCSQCREMCEATPLDKDLVSFVCAWCGERGVEPMEKCMDSLEADSHFLEEL